MVPPKTNRWYCTKGMISVFFEQICDHNQSSNKYVIRMEFEIWKTLKPHNWCVPKNLHPVKKNQFSKYFIYFKLNLKKKIPPVFLLSVFSAYFVLVLNLGLWKQKRKKKKQEIPNLILPICVARDYVDEWWYFSLMQ